MPKQRASVEYTAKIGCPRTGLLIADVGSQSGDEMSGEAAGLQAARQKFAEFKAEQEKK